MVACYSVDERTVGSSCCGWVCPLIIVSSDKDKPALKLDLSRRGQSRSGVGSWPASPVIGNCSELCLKLILLPTHWGKLHQAGKACCVINGKMGHWSFVSSPSPGERALNHKLFEAFIAAGLWQRRHDVVRELTRHVSVFPPPACTKGLPSRATCFAPADFFQSTSEKSMHGDHPQNNPSVRLPSCLLGIRLFACFHYPASKQADCNQ